MNKLTALLASVPVDQAQQIQELFQQQERKADELYGTLTALYMAVAAQYPYQSQHVTVEMGKARAVLQSCVTQGVPKFLFKQEC